VRERKKGRVGISIFCFVKYLIICFHQASILLLPLLPFYHSFIATIICEQFLYLRTMQKRFYLGFTFKIQFIVFVRGNDSYSWIRFYEHQHLPVSNSQTQTHLAQQHLFSNTTNNFIFYSSFSSSLNNLPSNTTTPLLCHLSNASSFLSSKYACIIMIHT